MLEVKDLRFTHGEQSWCFRFSVKRGELVQLIGESGSGKTTLLQMIGGFLPIASGDLLFDGKSMLKDTLAQGPTASLFQQRALFPHLTLQQNVALACHKRKNFGSAKQGVAASVEHSLSIMGLLTLKDRYPEQVSGGQAQLAALARLWLQDYSEILLLDEPLSALDPGRRLEILERLRFLVRRQNRAAILTTHAPQETAPFTDRALFLAQGKIKYDGGFAELFSQRKEEPYKDYFCPRVFS